MTNVTHETKRADQLKVGDWVDADAFSGDDAGAIAEILHLQPFLQYGGESRVLVIYRVAGDDPYTKYVDSDDPFRPATAVQIAAVKEEGRRWEVANALQRLASLILDKKLPLPDRTVDVSFHCADTAVVAKVAELIGGKVETAHRRHVVNFPALGEYGIAPGPVDAEWYCYGPPEPKPEPVPEKADLNFGRTTAVAEAKPDTYGEPVGKAAKAAKA
jgi:hypothetical protein